MNVKIETMDEEVQYYFIPKFLPAEDPCRVYVFEANVFEKEISIYFELLPCLRQSCMNTKLENCPRATFHNVSMDQTIWMELAFWFLNVLLSKVFFTQ